MVPGRLYLKKPASRGAGFSFSSILSRSAFCRLHKTTPFTGIFNFVEIANPICINTGIGKLLEREPREYVLRQDECHCKKACGKHCIKDRCCILSIISADNLLT